jgi:hypothetical protein
MRVNAINHAFTGPMNTAQPVLPIAWQPWLARRMQCQRLLVPDAAVPRKALKCLLFPMLEGTFRPSYSVRGWV